MASSTWLDAVTTGANAAARALGGEHAQLADVNHFENDELGAGEAIAAATLDMMSSAGNSLRHDRDLRYFTGLSSVAILTAGA